MSSITTYGSPGANVIDIIAPPPQTVALEHFDSHAAKTGARIIKKIHNPDKNRHTTSTFDGRFAYAPSIKGYIIICFLLGLIFGHGLIGAEHVTARLGISFNAWCLITLSMVLTYLNYRFADKPKYKTDPHTILRVIIAIVYVLEIAFAVSVSHIYSGIIGLDTIVALYMAVTAYNFLITETYNLCLAQRHYSAAYGTTMTGSAAREWQKIKDGMPVQQSNFDKKHYPAIYGALGEIATAEKLDKAMRLYTAEAYDDIVIIHGLGVKNSAGEVTSDIDHLIVSREHGFTCVDTKVFSTAPSLEEISIDGHTGWMLSNTRTETTTNAHRHIVSTCLYEARQLPEPPHNIFISLSGGCMKDPYFARMISGGLKISFYIDRYDNSIKRCDIPVTLIPSQDLANNLTLALLRSPGGSARSTLKALYRSNKVVLPE